MKNIIYLFALVSFLSCSNDDESESSFFTEDDGIVWLEDSETEFRNIVVNEENQSVRYFKLLDGDCGSADVMNEINNYNNETPRVVLNNKTRLEYRYDGWASKTVLIVSNNGQRLDYQTVYDAGIVDFEKTYFRTNEINPCD